MSASRSQNDHPPLEHVLVHLTVRDDDPGVGDLLLQPRGLALDRRDAVVDPEDLPLAQQPAPHGAEREPLVVLTDVGEHRLPVLGGVSTVDMSRMPASAISSVRGIGVAVIVRTSTCARSFFRRSLCATPNRCSSSTTTSPRSLNPMSADSRRWVPITTSIAPRRRSSTTRSCSGFETKREHRDLDREGRVALAERDQVLLGEQRRRHEHRHLLALHHDLERARTAISVLPNPTSPQINRSIGRGRSRSALTSSIAVTWSPVSSCGNASSSPSATACRGRTGCVRSTAGPSTAARARRPCPSRRASRAGRPRPVARAQARQARRLAAEVLPTIPTWLGTESRSPAESRTEYRGCRNRRSRDVARPRSGRPRARGAPRSRRPRPPRRSRRRDAS